jgi:hypothetical protein
MAKKPIDEATDLALVNRLLFKPNSLIGQPFSQTELLTGKTPDFRVFKNGQHVAYCEVKSPRDDRLDELLDAAPPGTIVGYGGNDPTFNRLARHIRDAAAQFDAVDPTRELPRILAIVNHDEKSGVLDLLETLTGKLYCEGGKSFPTMMHIARDRLKGVQYRIDLYVMINEHKPRVVSNVFTQDDESHCLALCGLLGLAPAAIMQLA